MEGHKDWYRKDCNIRREYVPAPLPYIVNDRDPQFLLDGIFFRARAQAPGGVTKHHSSMPRSWSPGPVKDPTRDCCQSRRRMFSSFFRIIDACTPRISSVFLLRWSLLVCTGTGLLDGTNLVVILVGGTTICSRFLTRSVHSQRPLNQRTGNSSDGVGHG